MKQSELIGTMEKANVDSERHYLADISQKHGQRKCQAAGNQDLDDPLWWPNPAFEPAQSQWLVPPQAEPQYAYGEAQHA